MSNLIQSEIKVEPFKHSVPMAFDWETDDPRMDEATDDLFPIFEGVRGHKKLLRKHLRLVLIVCSRMLKYNPHAYVGYSRSNNFTSDRRYRNPLGFTSRPLAVVVDILTAHGFLEHHLGFNHTLKKRKSSRFKATDMLIAFLQDYELENLKFKRALIRGGIVLKDENKRYVYNYEDTPEIIRSREILSEYNALIEQTGIQLSNQASEECYFYDHVQSFRIYNNSDFTQGGRFYGNWWLQCKREDRPYMIINDQSTIELDYKANHLCFIYALEDIEMPDFPNDDLYKLTENINRGIIKAVFTTSLNTQSQKEAAGAIKKEIRLMEDEEQKQEWKTIIHDQHSFNLVVRLLLKRHPVLENYLFTGMGVRLQFMDSQIAEIVLNHMTMQGIPTLCIHDSFIVQKDKEDELRSIMKEAYVILGYPDHIPTIH